MVRALIFTFFALAIAPPASAGFVELGASYNYRQNFVSEDYHTAVRSITGSIAYYFWELSAIEASYTDGTTEAIFPDQSIFMKFQLIGLDLVFTFAKKSAPFRPYVKIGGAYQIKSIRQEATNTDPVITEQKGESPSAGAGFRLMLSKTFAIKVGAEAWTSPLNVKPVTYDFAGRAGISWFF